MRHPERDPLLTAIFATIEPAIITSRGVTLEGEGYHPSYAVDITQDVYPMSQTLYYACGVLGMELPTVFHNPKLEAGLAYVHANPRAMVLGRAALETGEVPPQALAFVAAQKLAFFRPGMYVRQLVSTGTGLKAWLFGAIKSISPNFPVSAELEGPVKQAIAALEKLHPTQKEQLTSLVARLLSGRRRDRPQEVDRRVRPHRRPRRAPARARPRGRAGPHQGLRGRDGLGQSEGSRQGDRPLRDERGLLRAPRQAGHRHAESPRGAHVPLGSQPPRRSSDRRPARGATSRR